jgi:hypothetical protein
MKRIVIVTAVSTALVIAAGRMLVPSVAAQQGSGCLNGKGPDETPEQRARRAEAINYTRSLHNAEASFFPPNNRYGQMNELSGVNSIPAGASVQHATTEKGYLFSVKGTTGQCAFTIYSDQNGIIYFAEPMR